MQICQIPTHAHEPRQRQRRQSDELLALAEYLPREDRLLIEQVFGQGLPIAQVARLSRCPARQMQRRTASVVKRMKNKYFKFVALQMNTLPHQTRPIARLVVLHGLSLRQAAEKAGESLHHVRRHMNTVHDIAALLG